MLNFLINPDAEFETEEVKHLEAVLARNGYSKKDCSALSVPSTSHRRFKRPSSSIPYIPFVSNRIKHILAGFDVPVAMRPHKTL